MERRCDGHSEETTLTEFQLSHIRSYEFYDPLVISYIWKIE